MKMELKHGATVLRKIEEVSPVIRLDIGQDGQHNVLHVRFSEANQEVQIFVTSMVNIASIEIL